MAAGVPPATVLADAGYGVDTAFRDGITERGLPHVLGIQSHTSPVTAGHGAVAAKT